MFTLRGQLYALNAEDEAWLLGLENSLKGQ